MAQASFGKKSLCCQPLGLRADGTQEALSRPHARRPGSPGPPTWPPHLAPGPEAGRVGGARSPGSRQGLGPPPSDPRPARGEGFPGFCLHMAEERRRAQDGRVGPGGVVLRGCLASGSDASDSYENLAGTLFDSSDSALESLWGARPWGPRACDTSAACLVLAGGRPGQATMFMFGRRWPARRWPAQSCPAQGNQTGATSSGSRFPDPRVVCAEVLPWAQGERSSGRAGAAPVGRTAHL